MERIIASFKPDSGVIEVNDGHIGEIVIDGNKIEFYVREHSNPFVRAYYGGDECFGYTVYVSGTEYMGPNRTLDNSMCRRVQCVLKSAQYHKDPIDKENVVGFSFTIPEFDSWINMRTVKYEQLSMTEAVGIEEDIEDIILLDSEETEVRLTFSSKTCRNAMDGWSATSIVVEKVPEIVTKYKSLVSLERVRSDIQMNMEFWGLIIGRVSTAEDIRIHFCEDVSNSKNGHNCKLMFINADYSYNLRADNLFRKTNTNYKMLRDTIRQFYEGWDIFYHNKKYDYLRNNYFMVNRRNQPFLEDVFVTYVRFLEGYDLRLSGDDNVRDVIGNQIKDIEKEIKDSIRENDIKGKIENAIRSAVPDWNLNSSHATEIAKWIADGFIGKTTLETRIKRIDDKHFNIIAKNTDIINDSDDSNDDTSSASNYYRKIAITRNYYSHFKEDESGILNTRQMVETTNVLKGLILLIFYENMGMDVDDARKILLRDSELGFVTQCLMTVEEKNRLRASNAVDAQVIE